MEPSWTLVIHHTNHSSDRSLLSPLKWHSPLQNWGQQTPSHSTHTCFIYQSFIYQAFTEHMCSYSQKPTQTSPRVKFCIPSTGKSTQIPTPHRQSSNSESLLFTQGTMCFSDHLMLTAEPSSITGQLPLAVCTLNEATDATAIDLCRRVNTVLSCMNLQRDDTLHLGDLALFSQADIRWRGKIERSCIFLFTYRQFLMSLSSVPFPSIMTSWRMTEACVPQAGCQWTVPQMHFKDPRNTLQHSKTWPKKHLDCRHFHRNNCILWKICVSCTGTLQIKSKKWPEWTEQRLTGKRTSLAHGR